jgi:hypothetical protein
MVRHIRRGYDGTDENPLLMRWTIPAALMYCITIYTTIGNNNVNPFFFFLLYDPGTHFLVMSSLNFFCRANKRGRVYYFCGNNVQQQKINKLSASGVNGVPNELNEGEFIWNQS